MNELLDGVEAIILYVDDTHRSAEFYRDLGFEILKDDPGHAIANTKGFWLEFHDAREPDQQPGYRDELDASRKGAGAYIYVKTTNAAQLYQGIVSRGVSALTEPTKMPWGNVEFLVQDPDGYKLAFYQKL